MRLPSWLPSSYSYTNQFYALSPYFHVHFSISQLANEICITAFSRLQVFTCNNIEFSIEPWNSWKKILLNHSCCNGSFGLGFVQIRKYTDETFISHWFSRFSLVLCGLSLLIKSVNVRLKKCLLHELNMNNKESRCSLLL